MDVLRQPQVDFRRVRDIGHWIVSRSERLIERRIGNALKRRLPGLMNQHGVPGVQCAFSVGKRPVCSLAAGIAAIDDRTPLTTNTSFLAASLSKPVSALVVLELASQGKLQLDRPIGQLVEPKWAESLHRGLSASTLRDLLVHTANVPHFDSQMFEVGKADDVFCRTLSFEQTTPEQHAAREVGPEHSRTYTGRGYSILQLILERHLKMPFGKIASVALTHPSCDQCRFSIEAAIHPDVARDHSTEGKQLPQLWTPSLASSGLVCTAAGLAGTMQYALSQRHRPCINALFVRPPECEAPYTCGLHIWKDTDQRVLDHGAARPGMRGVLKIIPDAEIVFVMFANSGNGVSVSRLLVGLVEQLGLARL